MVNHDTGVGIGTLKATGETPKGGRSRRDCPGFFPEWRKGYKEIGPVIGKSWTFLDQKSMILLMICQLSPQKDQKVVDKTKDDVALFQDLIWETNRQIDWDMRPKKLSDSGARLPGRLKRSTGYWVFSGRLRKPQRLTKT